MLTAVGVGVGRILAGSETTVADADITLMTCVLAGSFVTLAGLHISAAWVGNEHSTIVIGSLVATGLGLVIFAAVWDQVSPLGLIGLLAGAGTLQVFVEVLTKSETVPEDAGSSGSTAREERFR